MKKYLALLLSLLMVFALVACGEETAKEEAPAEEPVAEEPAAEEPAEEDAESQATENPFEGKKAMMITDVGGINDESFNQSAWNGMERLQEELGVESKFIESHKDADYAPNLSMAFDEGNDMIWGIGFLMKDAITEAALDNPDQMYGLIDDNWADGELPNAIGVQFNAEHSSFLVGYIAGYTTETDKVGMVIGMESPTMDRFRYGYFAGVRYAANELGKEIEIFYTNIENFGDTAKGKAAAMQMFNDGADIVYHAAGQSGTGVIEAAKEVDKWAIGVDLDQNPLAPDNVLTSALKNVDVAIFDLTKRVLLGEELGGTTVFYGLEEGGVGIAPSSDKNVAADVLEKTQQVEEKIIAGEIEVPYTPDGYEAWTP